MLGLGKSRAKERLRAVNLRTGLSIAESVEVSDTAIARMRGLIGRDSLKKGYAIWLSPCNWVHTIGMRFPIDIIYLGRGVRGLNGAKVVALKEAVPKNTITLPVLRAVSVLELPQGSIKDLDIRVGDRIEIS